MATAKILLYRPSLDARSGAGQLLRMQWRGLRAARAEAKLGCERGAFRFFLRTGAAVRRLAVTDVRAWQRAGWLVMDHGLCVPSAEIVFVHNVASEAQRHVERADLEAVARREREFFATVAPTAVVVANSDLVKAALCEHFALPAQRIVVQRPGFCSARFARERAAHLRMRARRALALDERTPLVGFVTSGDFAKRGLDIFLEAAARIAAARADARFLVVGSKALPDAARAHALVRAGRVHYRPKSRRPEQWLAALDVFLYAARFEEFGMVVSEAAALGVPIVTSRCVGASECLPADYAPWLLERPAADAFAEHALALLDDADLRAALAEAGARNASAYDDRAYVRATLATLEAQKRLLR